MTFNLVTIQKCNISKILSKWATLITMKREKKKTKRKRPQKHIETLITMSSILSKSSRREVYNNIKESYQWWLKWVTLVVQRWQVTHWYLMVSGTHSSYRWWSSTVLLNSSRQDFSNGTGDVIIGDLVCLQVLFFNFILSFLSPLSSQIIMRREEGRERSNERKK